MIDLARYSILLLLACCSTELFAQSIMERQLESSIRQIVLHDTNLEKDRLPGFIVGIIDQDSTYFVALGQRAFDDTLKISKTDAFEIGSVTKLFTAAMIDSLIASGRLARNAHIPDILPHLAFHASWKTITVDDLVNHRAGLRKTPLMFGDAQSDPTDPYSTYTESMLIEDLKQPLGASEFRYSHFGYAVLGLIIEYVTGTACEVAFREFAAQQGFAASADDTGLVPGVNLAGKPAVPWSFPTFFASEGLRTNALSLVNFARTAVNVLPAAASEKCEEVNKHLAMCDGWYVVKQGKRKPDIFAHTGHTSGHYAFVGVVPSTGKAVVILANAASGTEDLGFLILRLIHNNWKRSNG